jgi:hypothetical protein
MPLLFPHSTKVTLPEYRGVSYRLGLGKADIVARAILLAPGWDAVDQVGPWHYPTHALDTLPDIADLPVGGLDWSDMA